MQLNLGETIRTLRHRDNRTQEALATALGVTAQAVSRWEAGGSYPDMELLPSIANYFGVSIDALFGYTDHREQRIDKLAAEIRDMLRKNSGVDRSINECIATARKALVEFPGNAKLMCSLAAVLYTAGYVRYGEQHLIDEEGFSVYDTATHQQYAEWQEAITLYEKVLETLPSGKMRDSAVEKLSQLYVNTGAYDKALALAESAPPLLNSKELLRIQACDGKLQAECLGKALLHTINTCSALIVYTTMAYQNHMTAAQKAQAISGAIRLFDQVCTDGNYGQYHSFIAHLHMLHSLYLWLDEKRDAAFAALDHALVHYRAFEKACATREVRYTAPLLQLVKVKLTENDLPDPSDPSVSAACLPDDWPWWSVPEEAEVKTAMQSDPRWAEWVAKTQA